VRDGLLITSAVSCASHWVLNNKILATSLQDQLGPALAGNHAVLSSVVILIEAAVAAAQFLVTDRRLDTGLAPGPGLVVGRAGELACLDLNAQARGRH
jgi:hypothetical protein